MSEFSAVISLSSLDGTNGFQINGEAIDLSGFSVSSAGDVNADGFDDLVIGAPGGSPNGNLSGASYVVFGKAGGFTATLELSSLDGTNGFQINGEAAGDGNGFSVSSAGDINGDGFDDVIVGAPLASPNGYRSGASYVVFGKAGGFASTLELSSLNGATGFQISGEATEDGSGASVSSAGDVNGDGFDDLIIGAFGADPNGSASGASYVVFGKAGGFASTLNLASLNGTTGFQINGEAASDTSGYSVSSAGDVNGDGFDDLIIGARAADSNVSDSGASYVVFGKAGGFASTLELSSLDGTNGFQIIGEAASDTSGGSVSSAGDVNGDGFDDLIIGANGASPNGSGSGASYVVFGKGSGFASTLNLASLDGTTGFQINGEAANDHSGSSVSSAGDVNGDGFDDFIVGPDRNDPATATTGATYVVFGKASGFDATLNLSGLDGTNGFQIGGPGDESGSSVSAAGDVNGDGFDDLVVGAPFDDPQNYFGASYVIFGRAPDGPVNRTGTAIGQTIHGGAFGDTLDGGGGADTLVGGAGDDWYICDVMGDIVTELSGGGIDLVGSFISYTLGSDVENLVLIGTGDNEGQGNALANALSGNDGDNRLMGLAGNDTLGGGAGKDAITGGRGTDKLIGDGGADTFVFARGDTVASRTKADTILDMTKADHIDLHLIDANEDKGGNQKFHFIGTDKFSGHAGELRYEKAGSNTWIYADTDGDRKIDFTIHLDDPMALKANYFLL